MDEEHPLKKYRTRQGITLAALAARVGVQKASLSKIENRLQYPRMSLAARIQEVTGGAITPNDFLPPAKKRARA